jgi:hypothetical protein
MWVRVCVFEVVCVCVSVDVSTRCVGVRVVVAARAPAHAIHRAYVVHGVAVHVHVPHHVHHHRIHASTLHAYSKDSVSIQCQISAR